MYLFFFFFFFLLCTGRTCQGEDCSATDGNAMQNQKAAVSRDLCLWRWHPTHA